MTNYKGALQEFMLEHHNCVPSYDTKRDTADPGPDHEPRFCTTITIQDNVFERAGIGSSKAAAEQNAACKLLHTYEELHDADLWRQRVEEWELRIVKRHTASVVARIEGVNGVVRFSGEFAHGLHEGDVIHLRLERK